MRKSTMRDDLHTAIEPLLIDYAAGTLDASDRNRVEAHLADCDECRVVLDEWRQIAAAARDGAFSRRALPPLDWHRIKGGKPVTLISRPKTQSVTHRVALPLSLVAVIALTAFLAAQLLRPPQNQQPSVAVLQAATATPTPTPTFTSTPTLSPFAHQISANPQLIPTVMIVVSVDDIVQGEIIQAHQVGLQAWPLKHVPRRAITDTADVVGLIARLGYEAGIPILDGSVTGDPAKARPVALFTVAVRNIENGAVVMPEDLAVYEMPPDAELPVTNDQIYDIVYRIARGNILCGELLSVNRLADNAHNVPEGQPDLPVMDCGTLETSYDPFEGSIYFPDYKTFEPPSDEVVPVVVYSRNLPAGSILSAEDLTTTNYPAFLAPELAHQHPEPFIGQRVPEAVVGGQIVSFRPVTNVVIMQETLEMPQDVQIGDVFDIYTVESESQASALMASGATVSYMNNGGLIFEVSLEDGPALQQLASDKSPLRLVPATNGQDIEVTNPVTLTGVFVSRTAVELPDDAKRGDVFDIFTQLPDSDEPSIAINDVVLWHLDNSTLILEVRVEDEPTLTALIRDRMLIRLVPTP
jgi:Flp pilus assembly protein CpaB